MPSAAWIERFIRPLKPIALTEDQVTMSAPGRFVAEWVRERYLSRIERILSDELGSEIRVQLQAESREKSEVLSRKFSHAPVTTAQTTSSHAFKPNPRYAFDRFVVGQSNRLAFAGAKAVADNPGEKFNPLFIYGSPGLGKTHLLHAIADGILSVNPQFPLVYVTAQQFAEEFVQALQTGKLESFRRAQRNVSVWLVDDIQFIAGKDKTQEEVFHTFNHLYQSSRQIVLCSDRPPRDLYLMDERLRSRFESGLVVDIQMPDTETRCAILQSKAAHDRIELQHEVAMYLAENVPGNIRILEGALTKLGAQTSVDGTALTLEAAQKMVEEYYQAGALAKPSFDQIVDAVSKHFKISTPEILGISRKAPIVNARHVAVFITREITGDSWKHIGGLFHDRDHTSMMHGYRKVSEMMHADRDFRNAVKMLIRNLYPGA